MVGATKNYDLKRMKKNSNTDIRERQPKLKMYAGSPSPVCSLVVSGGPKVTGVLRRSQTIDNCVVGGSRTYVSLNIGETINSVKGLMKRSKKRKENYEMNRIRARDHIKNEIKNIDTITTNLLSEGGAENYSRFVGDLPRIRKLEREAREKKEREDEHAALIQKALLKQKNEDGGGGNINSANGEKNEDEDVNGKRMGAMTKKKKERERLKKQEELRFKRRQVMLERKNNLAIEVANAQSGAINSDEALQKDDHKKTIDPDTIFRLLKLHYR